jgi:hypothetical protein
MLPIKNGIGANAALETVENAGVHTPVHIDKDRAALLAAVGAVSAALAGKATDAGLAAVAGHVDGVEALLTTLVAKVIAAPATEAKQDALKASIDVLLAAIRPAQNHFVVVPGADPLANLTRRIVCNADGLLTATVGGVSASYTVVAGQQLDIVATHVTAAPANTIGQY